MNEVRTYEQFSVHFARGTTISGYQTGAEAQAAADRDPDGDPGTVIRSTFTVEIEPKFAHLYQPGVVA